MCYPFIEGFSHFSEDIKTVLILKLSFPLCLRLLVASGSFHGVDFPQCSVILVWLLLFLFETLRRVRGSRAMWPGRQRESVIFWALFLRGCGSRRRKWGRTHRLIQSWILRVGSPSSECGAHCFYLGTNARDVCFLPMFSSNCPCGSSASPWSLRFSF